MNKTHTSAGAPPETVDHLRATLRAVAIGRPAVVVIGKFDGVHLGHAALLREASARARVRDAAMGVMTFDPLPYVVFNPGKPFHYLCSLEERVARLRDLGAAFVAVAPFSRAMAQVSAEQFVSVLQDELQMVELVIGPGAVVGHNREGNAPRLRALGAQLGFTVTEIAPVTEDGRVISSSQVRHALWDGDVHAAAQALGRFYTLDGVVQHGDKRGRALGYPTANLLPHDHLITPANGIYGCIATVNGRRHAAAVSIGVRPTFGDDLHRLIEAHLLDFQGDLYGQVMHLAFVHRVRGEQRFDSVDALIARMAQDVAEVRARVGGVV